MGRQRRRASGLVRWFVSSLIACMFAVGAQGCFNSGVTPRTADLLGPGEVGGGFNFTVLTFAPGEVTLDDGDTATGNSGKRALIFPLGWFILHGINTQGWLRVGLPAGFEIGATIGLQQLGGELRYALMDEDAKAPVSLALGGAVMWRTASNVKAPWFSFSVDFSRRFERLTSIFNVVLTYGPEDHALGLEEHQERGCGGFGDEGCGEYGPPRHFFTCQRELRLSTPVGIGIRERKYGGNFIISLVPYFNLWVDPDSTVLECEGCSYLTPVDFEEYWGVHLTFGYHFSGG